MEAGADFQCAELLRLERGHRSLPALHVSGLLHPDGKHKGHLCGLHVRLLNARDGELNPDHGLFSAGALHLCLDRLLLETYRFNMFHWPSCLCRGDSEAYKQYQAADPPETKDVPGKLQ